MFAQILKPAAGRQRSDVMIRQACTMKLKPGFAAEYKKRHDEIWPELARELRAAGVSGFSIFLDEKALTLFAVRKISDEKRSRRCPNCPSSANGGISWRR